ncbi:MAG: hypothetical protein ACOVSS_08275 [Bacteroidia bacterium]|jgi:hypothetical protein
MPLENTPHSGNGIRKSGSLLLIFLSGLAAGAASVYLITETKEPGKATAKLDSLPAVIHPTPVSSITNAPAPDTRPAGTERPKNLDAMPGGIDVNGFPQLAPGEAVAVSYQEYLGFTNAWTQSNPNTQPSCTWGGRIHKEALSRVINSLPDGNPYVRFKFGRSGTESRTFILFTGNLNAQGGSVIYRNGGEPATFCPIQCD